MQSNEVVIIAPHVRDVSGFTPGRSFGDKFVWFLISLRQMLEWLKNRDISARKGKPGLSQDLTWLNGLPKYDTLYIIVMESIFWSYYVSQREVIQREPKVLWQFYNATSRLLASLNEWRRMQEWWMGSSQLALARSVYSSWLFTL